MLCCACLDVSAQTTLTEDANGNLNTAKVVAATTAGQSFYIGHQLGASYGNNLAIFSALTDNTNGTANYFYDGMAGGNRTYFVRADGTGYFQGNFGVGSTNYNAKFTVYQGVSLGSTAQNTSLLSTISGLSGGNDIENNIWLVRNAAGSDWYTTRLHDGLSIDGSFMSPQVNTRTWWERDPSQDIQSWGTSGNTYLTINQGNVGIGTTTTQGYRLAVNGSVIATSVTVKLYNNWPDYVFTPTYQLLGLLQVKRYINQYHHLPDMPSASDVAQNGLNIGETEKILTQKVEELTLYLIDKDQQLSDQQAINAKQQQQLDTQAERITRLEAALETLTNHNQ